MYSILCGGKLKLLEKGVTCFAQGSLKQELYLEVLLTGDSFSTMNTRIGSKNHHLRTIFTKKLSRSALDHKMFVLEDDITCLSLAHQSIRDMAVFREILEEDGWGEDFSSSSPTWSYMENERCVSGADSPSTRTQNSVQANALDPITNWTPPDHGLNQRVFSEELKENFANSDSEG